MPALLERAVDRFPDRTALRERGQGIAYREWNGRANALARAILSRCGRGTEPILFLHGHDSAALVSLLAVLKTGRPYLPLNPLFPVERIQRIARESGAPALLTDTGNLAFASQAMAGNRDIRLLNADDVADSPRDNPGIRIAPDDPACILYTSGSTGEPKGIVTSHRYINFSTVSDVNFYRISPRERVTLLNAVAFSGSRTSIFGALSSGAALCIYDVRAQGPEAATQWMLSEQVTDYRSIAPIFRLIFSAIPPGVVIPSLRCVGVGGDTVRPTDFELFRAHTGEHCLFRNGLASTECGVVTEYFLRHDDALSGEIVPVGAPAAGKHVTILDENGAPVPDGETGEIAVTSRYLASGYWKSPDLTARKFIPNADDPQMKTFYTGDSGRFNADGALEHLGRLDQQVKVRGNRVDASEVERALRQIPGVREAVVTARPARFQPEEKQLAAYLLLREGAALSADDLRGLLADKLPDYMLPAFFVFLDAFPVNANGKLDRRALPDPARPADSTAPAAPASDAERRILSIWKRVFGVEALGVDENFFESGGDSLMAAAIFTEIERAFGKLFPANALLRHGTVRSLARLVEETPGDEAGFLAPLRVAGTRPPLFLVPGGGSDAISFLALADALGDDLPVYGFQDFHVNRQETIYAEGVAAAAREFITAMKSVQPRGPYRLAGHSFGGVIAFEMARQLRASGEAVGFLGILDSAPPVRRKRRVAWLARYRVHSNNLGRLDLRGKLAYLSKRIQRTLARLARYKPIRRFYRSKLARRMLRRDPLRFVSGALADYEPRPYEGSGVVYRVARRAPTITWDVTAPWKKWITGGLAFRDVPGEHNSIIREPHARRLAALLEQDLESTNRN
ncbi:MAG: AMP-binding protein [Chloroflexota bacterium]